MSAKNSADQSFDLIIFGATSFVGQILVRYLTEYLPENSNIRWAAAGRNLDKLSTLRNSLGDKGAALPLLTADAANLEQLKTLCQQTKVIISTVGPYALYGEPLIKACVQTGTDYCDLTGEVQWIAKMLARYETQAKESGARIVHCCGFDSIPSDMGVYYHQQQAQAMYGEVNENIKMRVKAMRGGMSGGTIASLVNVIKEASKDPALRKSMANPFSLCPDGHGFSARQDNVKSAIYDADFGRWATTFVMAAINTRIVHRSNWLLNKQYGDNFKYDEAMLSKTKNAAKMMSFALTGFMLSAAVSPLRWVMEKFLPAPGEGPSPQEQENGFFDMRFFGRNSDGKTLVTQVTGDRDPGYGSTAKMLAQAGLCLAQDISDDELEGGFWTPSVAMGDKLLSRLQQHAGLTFDKIDD